MTFATTSSSPSSSSSSSWQLHILVLIIFGIATLFRILIGFDHHSGQDNHHGSKVSYGGDFEAQRHWMELTYQLPMGRWYYYDLQYWGLDYPPLTAYQSWICGYFTDVVLGPNYIEFESSRGIEDPIHKAYMRFTVLILDLIIFGSAIYFAIFIGCGKTTKTKSTSDSLLSTQKQQKQLWTLLLTLSQPAILLIDHGHFQYNTVALGLSIFSFKYIIGVDFNKNCVIGSIFFCLALNFKQMTLYYSPAVFFYLLGRCLEQSSNQFLQRFIILGMTVITTFGILWGPFLIYKDNESTIIETVLHIIRRIFPFERGLFEGKVANLWCILSMKPINIRERISPEKQPLLALLLTLMMIGPSCYTMFQLGRRRRQQQRRLGRKGNDDTSSSSSSSNGNDDWNQLLWATTSCSLSFFLASFQVHEKSILLALAPCSLLLWEDPLFVDWFSIVCTWTLWPLLKVDRVQISYTCMIVIYLCLIWIRRQQKLQQKPPRQQGSWIVLAMPILSFVGMIGLHVLELVVDVPPNLPDLFEVLWSIAGCGMFCLAWLVTCWKLLFIGGSIGGEGRSKTKIQ